MSEDGQPNIFELFRQQELLNLQKMGIDPNASMFEQLKQKEAWRQQQLGIDPNASWAEQLNQMYQSKKNTDGAEDENPIRDIKGLPDGPLKPDPGAAAAYAKYEQVLRDFLDYWGSLARDNRTNLSEQLQQPQRNRGMDYDR